MASDFAASSRGDLPAAESQNMNQVHQLYRHNLLSEGQSEKTRGIRRELQIIIPQKKSERSLFQSVQRMEKSHTKRWSV
jgi:hypothetical protein